MLKINDYLIAKENNATMLDTTKLYSAGNLAIVLQNLFYEMLTLQ